MYESILVTIFELTIKTKEKFPDLIELIDEEK